MANSPPSDFENRNDSDTTYPATLAALGSQAGPAGQIALRTGERPPSVYL
jgi:hypothetical protein